MILLSEDGQDVLVRCRPCLLAREFSLQILVNLSHTIQFLSTRNDTYRKKTLNTFQSVPCPGYITCPHEPS